MYDTIIIGGGPAGLQAALTLGRMHRDVLLIDSGEYRNSTVEHAQNFMTLDGVAPEEIRVRALRDVAAYETVQVCRDRVEEVTRDGEHFVAWVGRSQIPARSIVLATGVRDVLPDIPGLAEVWGVEAANCPFCHGHEFAGRRVALFGAADHAAAMTAMLAPIVAETVVVDTVSGVSRVDGGLRLDLPDAEPLEVAGMFVAAPFVQSAPFAEQLGVTLLPSGCVEIDLFGHTSEPGVYAAGDLAHHRDLPMPMASLLGAANAGLMAASTAVRELAMDVV